MFPETATVDTEAEPDKEESETRVKISCLEHWFALDSIVNFEQCMTGFYWSTFPQATSVEDGGEAEEAGDEDRPDSVASKIDKKEPKITNQFNFSERASQTLNNPLRVRRISPVRGPSYVLSHIFCIVVEVTNI